MKKILQRTLILASCLFLAFACGGGGGGGGSTTNNNSNSADELDADAEDAFASSSWSDKTPGTVDSTNAETLSSSVRETVTNVTSQAVSGVSTNKSNKSTTISQTINGPLGGTAVVTGTYTYDTTPVTTYPMTFTYNLTVVFNNYKDSSIAINGEVSYEGSAEALSAGNMVTNIEINGGYSVLYQDQAYNLVTKLEAEITIANSNDFSVEYTYTVNGETYSGSTDLNL